MIATEDVKIRQSCRSTLYTIGFRALHVAGCKQDLVAALVTKKPQVLVVDLSLPGTDVCAGVADLRQGLAGPDPFLPIIVVAGGLAPEDVKRVIASGADDVVIAPWDAGYLDKRISALLFERKRFVVTGEYIGPDRRGARRDGGSEAVSFVAPNALAMRAVERLKPDEISRRVTLGWKAVQERRVAILAGFVLRVGLQAVGVAQAGGEPPAILAGLQRVARAMHALARVCQDLRSSASLDDIATLVRHVRVLRDQAPAFDHVLLADLVPRVIGLADAFGIHDDAVQAALATAGVHDTRERVLL